MGSGLKGHNATFKASSLGLIDIFQASACALRSAQMRI